jgi:Trk K+ transport system NAD-binding subunit
MSTAARTRSRRTAGIRRATQQWFAAFLRRANYVFDNALGSNKRFVGFVFALMILLAGVMTGIQAVVAAVDVLNVQPDTSRNYFEQFWASFAKILSLGGEATWGQRILGVLYWAIAIAVTGTVIGFITSLIQQAIARLGQGLSPVMNTGHLLILGWSPRLIPILTQISLASQAGRRVDVVVFSDRPRVEMENEIDQYRAQLGSLRVITRHGSLVNPAEIARANGGAASSIIVLRDDARGDAAVVTTVLALRAAVGEIHASVIVELDDPHIADTLHSATGGAVLSVRSQDIIARVTAQAARQPGLAAVVLDLLDFDGNEIYTTAPPAPLVGRDYGDAVLAYERSVVMGIQDASGNSWINPDPRRRIEPGDLLIVIAEDDSTIAFTGVIETSSPAGSPITRRQPQPQHILVVGWSPMGNAVLSHLAQYLAKGSSVAIVARRQFVAREELADLSFGDVEVSFSNVSGDVQELIEIAEKRHYDEVIVLGYRTAMSAAEADAQTLLAMLQMKQLFEDDSNRVKPTRVVAEILDSALLPLARSAAADDLVVSDVLSALLIAQLSQNPSIAPVLADLFSAHGAGIQLIPATDVVASGSNATFGELVSAGISAGVTVIGYRVAPSDTAIAVGVQLNPPKQATFTVAPSDSIIAICTDWE